MQDARVGHILVKLQNGQALVAGGPSSSAERYTPETRTWTNAGSPHFLRFDSAAGTLTNGKVLVAGGSSSGPLLTAEVYDPEENSWREVSRMATARGWARGVALPNNQFLIVGTNIGGPDAEIYDYENDQWFPTAPMVEQYARRDYQFTVTLLSDNKVMVGNSVANHVEIYDPATDTWTVAMSMLQPHDAIQAVALRDGRVLIASEERLVPEIYDPSTDDWTVAARQFYTHDQISLTMLQDSRVLAVSRGCCDTSAEVYNADDDTWTATTMLIPRQGPRSVLLDDGSVLVTGGFAENQCFPEIGCGFLIPTQTTELFTPSSGMRRADKPAIRKSFD